LEVFAVSDSLITDGVER